MNKDFVTYEIALILEEKGFDEPCYGYYHCNGGEFILEYRGSEIFIEQAIKLMETRGYIEPNDF